jgi:hypothetical protein
MSETEPSQLPLFETLLVSELNRLGVFAKPQFRIPGSHSTRLDIYIASPVRAFVEIKSFTSLRPSKVQQLIYQMELIRRQFGEEVVPILIIIEESVSRPPSMQALFDEGVFILRIDKSSLTLPSATRCARDIQTFLQHLPYRFQGIASDDTRQLALPARVSGRAKSEGPRASVPREPTQWQGGQPASPEHVIELPCTKLNKRK